VLSSMLTTLRVSARHVAGMPVIAQMGLNTKGFQPNLKPEYQSTLKHYSEQKRTIFHLCFFYFACVPILIFVSVRRILKTHRLNRHESSQRQLVNVYTVHSFSRFLQYHQHTDKQTNQTSSSQLSYIVKGQHVYFPLQNARNNAVPDFLPILHCKRFQAQDNNSF